MEKFDEYKIIREKYAAAEISAEEAINKVFSLFDVEKSNIVIEPELPIGTKKYILIADSIRVCVVSDIVVNISSFTDQNTPSWIQTICRIFNAKNKGINEAKSTYKICFTYRVHIDGDASFWSIEKIKDRWCLNLGTRIYPLLDRKEDVFGLNNQPLKRS